MCIATWSKMPHSRIINSDSLNNRSIPSKSIKRAFPDLYLGRLKTLALNRELVENKPVLQSKLDTFSDTPYQR